MTPLEAIEQILKTEAPVTVLRNSMGAEETAFFRWTLRELGFKVDSYGLEITVYRDKP